MDKLLDLTGKLRSSKDPTVSFTEALGRSYIYIIDKLKH